jgi:P-type Cu+ transporter
MYVAASGALVLAILHGIVYLGLAFGAITVTCAPIPNILYLTCGLLLFIIEREKMEQDESKSS